MARFNLSFFSIFLLLAVLAVSMPVKRDGEAPGQPLSLDKLTVSQSSHNEHVSDRNNE